MTAKRTTTRTRTPRTSTDTPPPATPDAADAQVRDELAGDPALDTPPIITPPAESAGAPRGRPRGRSSTPNLRDRIAGTYAMIGIVLTPIAPADARLFLEHGGDCADALDRWSQQSPKVRKALEAALTGSAMGAVIMAHVPLAIGVAANHGLIGPRLPRTATVAPDAAATDRPNTPTGPTGTGDAGAGGNVGAVPLATYTVPGVGDVPLDRGDVLPSR